MSPCRSRQSLIFLQLLACSCCSALRAPEQGSASAPAALLPHKLDPSLNGYEYQGKVKLREGGSITRPHLKAESMEQLQAEAAASLDGMVHYTTLITSDGHQYKKRLSTDGVTSDPFMARPSRRLQSTASSDQGDLGGPRRQLQQTTIANTTTDLSCQGCPSTDTRTQITQTTVSPYSSIGQLTGSIGNNSLQGLECTGTLIGRLHVLTAAHCVFDISDSHQPVTNINFVPALSDATSANGPYNEYLPYTTVRVVDAFKQQPSYNSIAMNLDFALITLKYAADVKAGHLSLAAPDAGVITLNITTAGYPGDKPSGTMWQSKCSGVQFDFTGAGFRNGGSCGTQACANIMQHTCLSSSGQSGSAMWDNTTNIRAILTGKVTLTSGPGSGDDYNVGTEVDSFVYNTVAQWYNEDGENGTLPMAPPGPPPQSAGSNVLGGLGSGLYWGSTWVWVIIGVGGGILLLAVLSIICTCCRRRRRAPKAPLPVGTYHSNPFRGNNIAPPPQRFSQQQQGVHWDPHRQQFMVNGMPYGQYQYGR